MRNAHLLSLLLCIVGWLQPLAGATYTVDATAVVAPGIFTSLSSLLATTSLVGDDIVQIHASALYSDRIRLLANHSGTPGHPVIIEGIDSPRAVWEGANADPNDINPRGYLWAFSDTCHDIELRHIEVRNLFPGPSGNNRAIYIQGVNITVRDCFVHHNPNGFFSSAPALNTLIEQCEISFNGIDGFEHNFYMQGAGTHIRSNYIHDANQGLNYKDRSTDDGSGLAVEFAYNHVANASNGGYELDFSIGGSGPQNALVIGNVIEKGPSGNQYLVISFGNDGRTGSIALFNNTIVADANTNPLLMLNGAGSATISNNIYTGSTTVLGGTTTGSVSGVNNWFDSAAAIPSGLTHSVLGSAPGFISAINEHLASGSSAIDAGAVTTVLPTFQYVPEEGSESRTIVGAAIDIGAYEFGNTGSGTTSTGTTTTGTTTTGTTTTGSTTTGSTTTGTSTTGTSTTGTSTTGTTSTGSTTGTGSASATTTGTTTGTASATGAGSGSAGSAGTTVATPGSGSGSACGLGSGVALVLAVLAMAGTARRRQRGSAGS